MSAWENLKALSVESWFVGVDHLPEKNPPSVLRL